MTLEDSIHSQRLRVPTPASSRSRSSDTSHATSAAAEGLCRLS